MLFEIRKGDSGFEVTGRALRAETPGAIGLREKDIENWLAGHPEFLLPNEELLVIAQSVSGLSMADLLALDASGGLVVAEIKRDWSDRETVGQLLEYAASLAEGGYDELNVAARRYSGDSSFDLYEAFVRFSERDDVDKEDIGNRQRVLVVAPQADESLRSIVRWLRGYGVPIDFVPFTIFADEDGQPTYIDIDGLVTSSDVQAPDDAWDGHWIFNTNETHSPGAWQKMFDREVAAIYGYPNGPRNLEGSSSSQRVFAYVNGQGIRALGTIVDGSVQSGEGIFLEDSGKQLENEFHLKVTWDVILPEEKAISSAEAIQLGYNLPIRNTFARLHKGRVASRIQREVEQRSND